MKNARPSTALSATALSATMVVKTGVLRHCPASTAVHLPS